MDGSEGERRGRVTTTHLQSVAKLRIKAAGCERRAGRLSHTHGPEGAASAQKAPGQEARVGCCYVRASRGGEQAWRQFFTLDSVLRRHRQLAASGQAGPAVRCALPQSYLAAFRDAGAGEQRAAPALASCLDKEFLSDKPGTWPDSPWLRGRD